MPRRVSPDYDALLLGRSSVIDSGLLDTDMNDPCAIDDLAHGLQRATARFGEGFDVQGNFNLETL